MGQTEKARLYSFVGSLSKEDLLKIEISGFCDDVGAENYNLVLSVDCQGFNEMILLFLEY